MTNIENNTKIYYMKPRYHFVKDYQDVEFNLKDISLIQLGRRYCSHEEIIPTHTHKDFYELTIVTSGEGNVISNGKTFPVKAGDMHLSIPYDIHQIIASSNSELEYDFFAFRVLNDELYSELKKISNDPTIINSRTFVDNKISELISNAISELSTEKPYGEKLLENIFSQIVIYLIRDFNKPTLEKVKYTQSEILCYQIMNYIDTHIYSLKKLDDLAAITNYSYGYLSAIFKKTTSNTLSDYYHKKKLDAARLLILENKYKIIEIAEMLNYSSVYSFSKAFTKRFGISPRNYKALH